MNPDDPMNPNDPMNSRELKSSSVRFSRTLNGVRPYAAIASEDSATLALDRTEPPVRYREEDLVDVNSIGRYPDPRRLQQAFADRFGLTKENVLITAGADEALDRACRTFLTGESTELVTIAPTFEMIARYASLAGASIRAVDWMDGEFPLNEFLQTVSARSGLIVLVTPNNPTGMTIPAPVLSEVAMRFPNIPLVVDLAYIEFASSDPTVEIMKYHNVIAVRTLSKAYGLPGIRIGCAIGRPALIGGMEVAGGPYAVSSLSLAIAEKALCEDDRMLRRYIERIRLERNELCGLLTDLGIAAIASEANFVLLRTADPDHFDQTLKQHGLRTRSFADEPLARMRRITMPGNPEAFERLKSAIAMTTNILPS